MWQWGSFGNRAAAGAGPGGSPGHQEMELGLDASSGCLLPQSSSIPKIPQQKAKPRQKGKKEEPGSFADTLGKLGEERWHHVPMSWW